MLYFLKILKKSGLQSQQLRHFYLSVIRPILEYCSPIWHHGLNKAQAESLEAIKRRALRIIDSSTVGMPYEVALRLTHAVRLSYDRREHLNKKIFTSITIPSSCISRLLPPLRDSSITSRLRRPTPSLAPIPRPATRTKRLDTVFYRVSVLYACTDSIRLSVLLYVTLWCCIKTNAHVVELFPPPRGLTLVF